MNPLLDINALDRIVKETIEAIERSQVQIYEIAENTRVEANLVSSELSGVKNELNAVIAEVDKLEREERRARLRLAEVSKDFNRYTEQDIKAAYDKAYNLQIELIKLREKEKVLQYRRNHLEMSLRRLQATIQKAEKLISQVGVVLSYLNGGLHDLSLKIGEMQQTQQMALDIIRAQEEERKRVAREIHDGPAQTMANIIMRAEYCLKLLDRDPEKVREELLALQNIVMLSLQDVRMIIFDLRPMVLDDLGLAPALKRYFASYKEQYGLEIEFLFFGQERRLESTIEIALFRIIQEAVNNIKKHARVKSAVVKMEMQPDKITVSIRDTGKGFDLNSVQGGKNGNGYGLVGMRERVQLLNGEMKINTAPGKGTCISITIPLQDQGPGI
ncbi:histidine kinase [Moorella sp. E308F]|uniref:sensor histidine kinase n=1 Tax=unclassified Neomoorella TaxID=2676739 RepID=UPI0010FFBFB0|nr:MULTISPECIES: sensor histidine kinase [unclassified Moorella (in: firmicutes)]GEA15870.1 histidine kinase [Moorella sp. E308F]GEA19310.1 histidine kinase [Moorella sp. E306M]